MYFWPGFFFITTALELKMSSELSEASPDSVPSAPSFLFIFCTKIWSVELLEFRLAPLGSVSCPVFGAFGIYLLLLVTVILGLSMIAQFGTFKVRDRILQSDSYRTLF